MEVGPRLGVTDTTSIYHYHVTHDCVKKSGFSKILMKIQVCIFKYLQIS